MPSKRLRKPTPKALQSLPNTIVLDDNLQPDPIANTSLITSRNTSPNESLLNKPLLPTTESSYPLQLLLSTNDTQDMSYIESARQKTSHESTTKDEDDNRLT